MKWIMILALLAGCAGDHNKGARPGGPEGPHLKVPFFTDRRDMWGPSALASVLGYWGRPIEPAVLRREIFFPKQGGQQGGSVTLDLLNAARARGLAARMSSGSLIELKRELDAGRPVIVLVNTGFRLLPVRAFMVVTGYNEWLRGVTLHSGPRKDFFITYARFEKTWGPTGRWMLTVAPVGRPSIVDVTAAPHSGSRSRVRGNDPPGPVTVAPVPSGSFPRPTSELE